MEAWRNILRSMSGFPVCLRLNFFACAMSDGPGNAGGHLFFTGPKRGVKQESCLGGLNRQIVRNFLVA